MDSIPYVCILVAFVLIYVPRMVVSREMKAQGRYDNHEPRLQQATLEGVGRRAVAAHNNSIEAFPPFAIAVLAALGRFDNPDVIRVLAIAFCLARMGYIYAYITDKASLRSGLWTVGMLVIGALMILAIKGA